jgi:hypothetical protein
MPWEQSVFSSMVASIGYDEERQEMYVTWQKSRRGRSIYSGVPEDIALRVANAASVGGAINAEIKPYYPHRYTG